MHIHEPHHLPAEVPDPAAQDEVTVIPLKIEDWLTVIVMGLLALITFANVLVRYFTKPVLRLDRRVLGVPDDRAGAGGGLGLGGAQPADPHRVLCRQRLGRAPARAGPLWRADVALLFALIAVLSTRVVYDDIRFGETSPGIGVPQWWYTIWLPVIVGGHLGRAMGLFIRRGRQAMA
jgi:hypothetical protein